jgi:hypothetical protein
MRPTRRSQASATPTGLTPRRQSQAPGGPGRSPATNRGQTHLTSATDAQSHKPLSFLDGALPRASTCSPPYGDGATSCRIEATDPPRLLILDGVGIADPAASESLDRPGSRSFRRCCTSRMSLPRDTCRRPPCPSKSNASRFVHARTLASARRSANRSRSPCHIRACRPREAAGGSRTLGVRG